VRNLSILIATLWLLRDRADLNPNMIAVVGLGAGGLKALWTLAQMPEIAKGVVMSQRG